MARRKNHCRKCADEIWKNGLCRDCSLLAVAEWYKLYGAIKRWRHLYRRYCITKTDYYRLLRKQKGKCAICRNPPDKKYSRSKFLHVDHSHKTDQNRGLLCIRCNLMVGQIENAVLFKAAMKYLKLYKKQGE